MDISLKSAEGTCNYRTAAILVHQERILSLPDAPEFITMVSHEVSRS